MKPFAIEPDDRAFALARDGVVLASSPSAVSDGSAAGAAGADAWHSVRQLPTTTSTRHLGNVLRDAQPAARALSLVSAEFARRLAAHPPAAGELPNFNGLRQNRISGNDGGSTRVAVHLAL